LPTDTRTRKPQRPARVKAAPRPEQPMGGQLALEVWGIVLLALAGVCVISLARGPEGRLGGALASALVKALGRGAYTMPALWCLTGLLMLLRRTGYLVGVRLVGVLAAGLALVIGFDIALHRSLGSLMSFRDYLAHAPHDAGGGWVGALGAWLLVRLVGVTGSAIVLVAMGVAGLSTATNVPVVVAASFVVRTVGRGLGFVFRTIRVAYDAMVLYLFEVDGQARGRAQGARKGDSEAEAAKAASTARARAPAEACDGEPVVAGRRRGGASLSEGVGADIGAGSRASEAGLRGPQGSQVLPGQAARPAGFDALGADGSEVGPSTGEARGRAGRAELEMDVGAERVAKGVQSGKMEQLKLIDDSAFRDLPPLALLRAPLRRRGRRDRSSADDLASLLEDTLASFGVEAKVVGVSQGPVVTRFEVQPGVGVKVSKIVNLADDIALAFASSGVRIEAPIPGKAAVGIEVPGHDRDLVYLREVLESEAFQRSRSRLTVGLGKDIAGSSVVGDLGKMLHLLVAGATGSGKSVCLNCIICSILFKATPGEVRFLMIDPKRVELSVYDGIPHLLAPVVTDPKKAAGFLRWVVEEMESRYKLFQLVGARNISQYSEMVRSGSIEAFLDVEAEATGNGNGGLHGPGQESGQANGELAKALPYIVVIVDELADLMMVAQNEVEDSIARLAFMARAAGIHLILATQRPSVDIVTGVIKANIPSRIAFAVSSQVDSRIILDSSGAERLLGKGDMLFHPIGLPKPIRVQGAFISDEEVAALVAHLKNTGAPVYEAEDLSCSSQQSEGIAEDDELFADAARLVVQSGEASISKVQRRFRVGYARAARLIDTMEVLGIVGPSEGSKARKVLVNEGELERILEGRD
jgi:S-DNA-T family DNA segregation ATPase FtsK/SpoIIIE